MSTGQPLLLAPFYLLGHRALVIRVTSPVNPLRTEPSTGGQVLLHGANQGLQVGDSKMSPPPHSAGAIDCTAASNTKFESSNVSALLSKIGVLSCTREPEKARVPRSQRSF